jgi:hypothetical protein
LIYFTTLFDLFFVINHVSNPIPQTEFRHGKTDPQKKKKRSKISCFDVLNVLVIGILQIYNSVLWIGIVLLPIRTWISILMPIQTWIRIGIKTIPIHMRVLTKFYTCWKIVGNIPFSLAMPVYVFPFSVAQVSMILSILDSILNFLEKVKNTSGTDKIRIGMPWMPIPIRIRQNDADPTRSGSLTLLQ